MCRLNTAYSFDPMPSGVDPRLILGIQGNLWTEHVCTLRHAEYMTWPRAFAIAETAWSPKELKDWPEFLRRVEAQFGASTPPIGSMPGRCTMRCLPQSAAMTRSC